MARKRRRLAVATCWLAWALPHSGAAIQQAEAEAPPTERADVHFTRLAYVGGNDDPRPHGLSRLAWEIRRRTSVAIALDVAVREPGRQTLAGEPLLVWQGDAAFAPLSAAATESLRANLLAGGSLLVDVGDAADDSPFEACVRRELGHILPDQRIVPIAHDHVLYRSFYLQDRHGGRVARRSELDGIFIGDRLAVVIYGNDLAGAMARNAFGEWDYDVGDGGLAQREMSFRMGINWVMYVLCLDYKDDQVHLPFILQRRH